MNCPVTFSEAIRKCDKVLNIKQNTKENEKKFEKKTFENLK